MTNREKFEAWYSDFSGQAPEWVLSQRDGDRYRVGKYVQGYWLCYQAALASQQPADDGWIDWKGGECPVDGNADVEIKFRDGCLGGMIRKAGGYYWGRSNAEYDSDIIAYRVVKP